MVLLLGCGLAVSAADSTPGVAVQFWDEAGPITAIERATLVQVPASAGNPATWEIKGARSNFRIKREPALLFLAQLPEGVSPSKMKLYRLTGTSARRPYPPGEGWRTAPLSVTEAGGSYGLAPVGELTDGEYAFVRAGSNEVFCFGVDK